MVSVTKLPKHVLSITQPKARHEYQCVWCGDMILTGSVYVRCVWESDEDVVNSDHICVSCWSKE